MLTKAAGLAGMYLALGLAWAFLKVMKCFGATI
jgi:hypothetical protein